ncbi:MAG: peptide deformylase [Gammaproteobacteria bacterium]|nr:peptide deformylase [Gammaproteobacteria bacterium]
MAVRDILLYPNPQLKQVAQPVQHFDAALQAALTDLLDTMYACPGTVGIAAPQLAIDLRLVIVDASCARKPPDQPVHGRLVLVNPQIMEAHGEVLGREGCLSVPDYTGNVQRAEEITVVARDAEGDVQQYQFAGYEARIVQHELDHLDGILFLDRVVSRRTDLFPRKKYR